MKAFYNYIEELSRRHPDIAHNPEAGEVHFVTDALFEGKSKSVLFPLVVADTSDFSYTGQPGAERKSRGYSLMFVTHVKAGNDADKEEAWQAMEALADEFVCKMHEDKVKLKLTHLLFFDRQEVEGSRIENKSLGLYGCMISWTMNENYKRTHKF